MNDFSAIKATFSDYKRIKTRKVAQLIFEVPLELLHETITKLGGEPALHEETWCAIARLIDDNEKHKPLVEYEGTVHLNALCSKPFPADATKPKREMTLANFIGLEISKPEFHEFLKIKYPKSWKDCMGINDKQTAKFSVRLICNVDSLSEITYEKDTLGKDKWIELFNSYKNWLEKQS